ncbi:MAG: LysM peptidoglycan-binding domain-containing protein, partial [Anaerolineae bacterium]
MKWRHWAILLVLVLLNYIIFSTALAELVARRGPQPRPTCTTCPTFTAIAQNPVAWKVLPTSTPRPWVSPGTPAYQAASPTALVQPSATATPEIEAATASVTAEVTNTVAPTLTPLPTATTVEPTPSPAATVIHKIKRGETLSGIAIQYGVSIQAIVGANGLENPSLIITGQRLIIPLDGEAPIATATRAPTRPPATTNTPRPPTATPVPTTSAGNGFRFTGVVVWDPLVAPNCSGPAISRLSVVQDAAGNPLNGVRIEVNCYDNVWLSHPTGNPGEYEPGHYDFAFGQLTPQDWTCTARVYDADGQPVTSSQIVTIHF